MGEISFSAILTFVGEVLAHIPWEHWAIIGLLSLALVVFLPILKKNSVYGAIALGISVFIGLSLLDSAVLTRPPLPYETKVGLETEFHRFLVDGKNRWIEVLCNIAVFIPFGFFLSEFLSSEKRFSVLRQIGYVSLTALGLSLCVESLQLILHVGYFELTDLVMNTMGAFIGAGVALAGRKVLGSAGK